MKTDIRKIICVWLLLNTFSIMPTCDFKTKFANFLKDNIINF